MAPRARRKAEESAPEVATVTPEIQQEEVIPMADETTVVDDVVEDEATPAKRGRAADPLNVAVKAFQAAKVELDRAKAAKPLDEAQAEYDTARTNLETAMNA